MSQVDLTFLICLSLNIVVSGLELKPGDCTETYCYDLDFEKLQKNQFGSKTPYPRYTDFDVNQEFIVPNCTPTKLWLLVRHGARLPTPKELLRYRYLLTMHDDVIANYEKNQQIKTNRCRMCKADYELIRNWKYKSNLSKLEPNHLLPEGFNEMKRLGENMQKMFPVLFNEKYSKNNYMFGSAKEHRTRFSYHGFTEGLFGENAYQHIKLSNLSRYLLEPYSLCKGSIKNSLIADSFKAEKRIFTATSGFVQMIRDISLRLGYSESISLNHLSIIWEWCRYEQSWAPNEPSPWCVSFLPHHYPYLDYWDDLEFYYKKAYGSNVTSKLTCVAINDLLYFLDNQETPKVSVLFVHSTFMQLFQTALGLFHDSEHLRADNFDRMKDRLFRSSINLPMSSNIGVVKYSCPGMQNGSDQVMFLLNQKPMNLSWCSNSICNLSGMKKTYAHFVSIDCAKSFCDPNFGGFGIIDSMHISTRLLTIALCMIVIILSYVGFFKFIKYYIK